MFKYSLIFDISCVSESIMSSILYRRKLSFFCRICAEVMKSPGQKGDRLLKSSRENLGGRGEGPGGVRLFVDSTTFLLSVYNLQQKFEQNLHLHIIC